MLDIRGRIQKKKSEMQGRPRKINHDAACITEKKWGGGAISRSAQKRKRERIFEHENMGWG